jgi:SAM-dependent methyltransferase
MRYKLAPDIEIRTENAAKPEGQASRFLLELLSNLGHVGSTFDYGCGKLRYQTAIAETTDTLAIVDSEVQLSRRQILRGEKTSIRNIYEQTNRVQVYSDLQFQEINARFDRGFCINVLSVIPFRVRREQVLQSIHGKLRRGGECLFVVQYRNSHFARMRQMPNAKPWLDGFVIDSLRGYSFYGLISPNQLELSLRHAGFCVRETDLNEGSAYCWVTR